MKLETAVEDDAVDRVIETIVAGARNGPEGRIGDGKIFVAPPGDAVRVRTGEAGADAL